MFSFTFLICSERSGSNFLTALMNGHSKISGPPPTHLFRLFGLNAGNYGDLESDDHWETLIHDVVENYRCMLGEWTTSITAQGLAEGTSKRTIGEILRIIYEKEASADGASDIFVKENQTYRFVPFLMAHFPDCRFVYMVRDPRDTAASYVKTDGIPGGVEKAVSIWGEDQSRSLELREQLSGTGRMAFVRYEDILADPFKQLTRLTEFLGLSFEENMLDLKQHSRTLANAERIDAWSNLGGPILTRNSGKYAGTLSEHDVLYTELMSFELMIRLGYQPKLITENRNERNLNRQLEELRPRLSTGRYIIRGPHERLIREKRLAAIERVLSRRLC
jgi:hypothetical protein